MKLACRPLKPIQLPVSGTVDITRVRPIVDHPRFQKTRYRMQLGEAHMVYPDARHPRFSHMLGAYKWTGRRLRRWRTWRMITRQDQIDGETFALLHDIDHGPRSHVTDPLVGEGHEERALNTLEIMSEEIALTGADPARMVRMMRREDPLAMAVLATPGGAEKLDYLARDAHHTGLQGMPEEGPFLDYIYYLNREMVVDSKIYGDMLHLMAFYRYMYERVYFRTAILLSERFLQRMISRLLGQTGDDPEFTEQELVEMTDSDLDYHLSHARNPLVREEYERYMDRQQPMPAIAIKLAPYYRHHWVGRHAMRYLEGPEGLLTNPSLRDPRVLHRIERLIEQEIGMPAQSVLLVPPVPSRRFEPQNIRFRTDEGVIDLETMSPGHWQSLREDAKRHACLYFGTFREHCGRLAEKSTAMAVLRIVTTSVDS